MFFLRTQILTDGFGIHHANHYTKDAYVLYLRRDSNSHLVVRSHMFCSIELRRYKQFWSTTRIPPSCFIRLSLVRCELFVCMMGSQTPILRTKTACPAIRRGNNNQTNMSKNFFELRTRFELISPDYKSGASPTMLTEPI